ncbi:MAG: hypothetical protein WCQ72_04520, partial [Eubacteriales bacterium]
AYFAANEEYAACVNATIVLISHAGAAPSHAHRSNRKRATLRGRKTVGLSVLSGSYPFRKRKIIDKPSAQIHTHFAREKQNSNAHHLPITAI